VKAVATDSYEMLLRDLPHSEVKARFGSGFDINAPDPYGSFLLTSACEQLQFDNVRYFISHGAELNCRSISGDTPLLCAIDFAHHNPASAYEIVSALISAGADIEARGYMDKTPFLKACSRGCMDILRLLVASGCDINAVVTDLGHSASDIEFAGIFDTSPEFKAYLHGLYRA
jgi:ankyrin repeat protein